MTAGWIIFALLVVAALASSIATRLNRSQIQDLNAARAQVRRQLAALGKGDSATFLASLDLSANDEVSASKLIVLIANMFDVDASLLANDFLLRDVWSVDMPLVGGRRKTSGELSGAQPFAYDLSHLVSEWADSTKWKNWRKQLDSAPNSEEELLDLIMGMRSVEFYRTFSKLAKQ